VKVGKTIKIVRAPKREVKKAEPIRFPVERPVQVPEKVTEEVGA